ncbi:MAG: insulinase family protein, partial [Muribaculaceae bacterium]|nr:insulinase family protein [Muribaculaceae bacterium]
MSVCVPQPAAAGNSDLASDTIALPKGTVEGVLPNGLRYLILPNGFPAGRTEFRLVWKVGSVQQDDSQGGCAHFLEHMAFGGSENFPDRGAVAYLESLGMKYG